METSLATSPFTPLPSDRMLACSQCGVTFVWTGWEQRHDATPPVMCPGCRHLLAVAPRYGVVKWFDNRKGFGVIRMTDGTEAFVRRRDVRGKRTLRKGQLVSFFAQQEKNGWRARRVKKIPQLRNPSRNTDSSTSP